MTFWALIFERSSSGAWPNHRATRSASTAGGMFSGRPDGSAPTSSFCASVGGQSASAARCSDCSPIPLSTDARIEAIAPIRAAVLTDLVMSISTAGRTGCEARRKSLLRGVPGAGHCWYMLEVDGELELHGTLYRQIAP